MKQTLDAIYENGVFRPLKPPRIMERQKVTIIVETPPASSCDELLDLAANVYEGLSEEQINDVEKIALNRDNLLKDRNHNDSRCSKVL